MVGLVNTFEKREESPKPVEREVIIVEKEDKLEETEVKEDARTDFEKEN